MDNEGFKGFIEMYKINKEIVEACQQGNIVAFKELYEAYHRHIYHLAYGFVKNTANAEDLTQDIFLKVFEKIDSFRSAASFSTWLYRVAVNECLQYTRQKPVSLIPLEEIETSLTAENARPSDTVENGELRKHLEDAISSLPECQKLVFTLTAVEGMRYGDVAQILDVTTDAVRMMAYRARLSLRRHLMQKGVDLNEL